MSTAATRKRTSGTTKRDHRDEIEQVFRFPGLSNLGEALQDADHQRNPSGRPSTHEIQAMLTTTACSFVTGSRASALTMLHDPPVWESCRGIYYDMTGVVLPDTAPMRNHLDHFRRWVTTNPRAMDALKTSFTTASVKQAQLLGNLLDDTEPDWSQSDERHTIFGDGTILKPFSDVVAFPDPITGQLRAHGSRASSVESARIQWETRRPGVDEKAQTGINFVSVQTQTEHGRIVLGIDSTLKGELPTALDVIDRVVAAAGMGVHTVVYDMAVTGWAVDYLMGRHRIQVQGKVPARNTDNDKYWVPQLRLDEHVAALAAQAGAPVTALTAPVYRATVLDAMFDGRRLSRVGTSVYPPKPNRSGKARQDAKYDLVNGYFAFLQADHILHDGTTCSHDLVLDDGALFTYELDEYGEELVKTQHLRCQSATAIRGPKSTWGTSSTYTVPCEHGDFVHTRTWLPSADRHASSDGYLPDPIGTRLRPIPRIDAERFIPIDTDRNSIESYNAWFKGRLPGKNHDRAASLTRAGQELDFLLGAVVNNALTWANYQGL